MGGPPFDGLRVNERKQQQIPASAGKPRTAQVRRVRNDNIKSSGE